MTPNRREFLVSWAVAGAVARGAVTQPRQAWPSTFPALRQRVNDQPLVFLDSAATTLRPQSVIDALVDYYSTDNANPSRVHTLASRAADRLAAARQTVARFVNATDATEIVFVRGSTEGLNLVAGTWGAANLRAGDEVLLTIAEHASNLMPWVRVAKAAGARVRILDVDDSGQLRLDTLSEVITSRTRLVAVSHASNVLGILNPVKPIVQAARAVGALTFVDGAQGAPHAPIDVKDLGCDFYAFSGHKLCGPMGAGVLWVRRTILDGMAAYHVGSNMAHGVEFEATAEFETGGLRFQAGTPDVAAAAGLAAAVRFLNGLGRDAVWAHDQALVKAARALTGIKGLRVIGDLSAPDRVPVFSFVLEGRTVPSVAEALDRRGIGVRGGDLAALPLLKRFGLTEAVRASAYIYSSSEHIARLAEALQDISRGRS